MRHLILFCLAIMISVNVNSQGFSTKPGGNCYTLDIPDYLTKTYTLNDVASMQYQNTSKEAYVIVVEDEKDQLESLGMKFVNSRDFLENFLPDYLKDAKKRKQSSITEFISNDNGHSQVELTWEADDNKLYMLVTSVETKTHFYKVMCWTITENVDKLKSDFISISKSLKE